MSMHIPSDTPSQQSPASIMRFSHPVPCFRHVSTEIAVSIMSISFLLTRLHGKSRPASRFVQTRLHNKFQPASRASATRYIPSDTPQWQFSRSMRTSHRLPSDTPPQQISASITSISCPVHSFRHASRQIPASIMSISRDCQSPCTLLQTHLHSKAQPAS